VSKTYWQDRDAAALTMVTERKVQETDRLLAKAYRNSATKIIEEFEATYNKLLNTIADDKNPTPADLYKLDKYWKMNNRLNDELRTLGQKQEKVLSRQFMKEFAEIYGAISFKDIEAFSTISEEAMIQAINTIWCADGKTWSQRIWDNIENLTETLQEELIHCVVTGKSTSQLKALLQERFDVSFTAADSLVRTEMAHIQTKAAAQRYKDYGITEVQVWADKDERRCEKCGKLHEKKFSIHEHIPIPAHPRCRCTIVPVVE
jgi:SPP1 gp7 family putative phage head morphogenesis protein